MTAAGAKTHLDNLIELHGKYQNAIIVTFMIDGDDDNFKQLQADVSYSYAQSIELIQENTIPIETQSEAVLAVPPI